LRGRFLGSADSSQHIAFGDDTSAKRDAPVVVGDQILDGGHTMMRFGFVEESF
jgi:hypothetical protein